MGVKKSIMISVSNAELIKKKYDGEWSYGVNRQFDLASERDALLQIVAADSLPDLDLDTWQLVLNAYNGTWWPDIWAHKLFGIASAVMDDHGVEILSESSEDFQQSVKKLADLSVTQRIAVLRCAEWFWNGGGYSETQDFTDYLDAFKKSSAGSAGS